MTTPNLTPEAYPEKHVQERLLNAAEQLFCEHGFEGTSVRDIAAAAGCNIASVNYYFGGKDKLYVEVWRRHLNLMRQERIGSINKVMSQDGGNPSLEDLLRAYSIAFVEPLMQESRGTRFVTLMIREMIDRRLPENMLMNEMIVPVMVALEQALCKICPGLQSADARLAILSVVGQLMHMGGMRTMFEQTGCTELLNIDFTNMVEHIVRFSAAGIRACVQVRNSSEGE